MELTPRRLQSLLVLLTLVLVGNAAAGEPEYMRLPPEVGVTLEADGVWRDDAFVVDDMEVLPEPRRPKLRGAIESWDPARSILRMYGLEILVDDDTEFRSGRLADLADGRRIELTGDIDETDGAWRARRIETEGIKDSDKIKGTITAIDVDGVAPDFVYIHSLKLLLDEATDVEDGGPELRHNESELLDDLGSPQALDAPRSLSHLGGRSVVALEYRQNVQFFQERDLSRQFRSDREDTEPELRAGWYGYWREDVRTLVQARARRIFLLGSELATDRSGDLELQLTQAQVVWRDPMRLPMTLRVGRQEFDEPREWLYDDFLDAARLVVYAGERGALEVSGIRPFHHYKDKFATWTDFLAEAKWWVHRDMVVGAYLLRRWDSDETRNREPVWFGLRAHGGWRRDLDTWLEASWLRGTDKQQDLDAWAFDVGGTWRFEQIPLDPALSLGLAHGSGDRDGGDGIDNEFRQTGYEDNNARLGGLTSVRYYGELLDPELSNLRVLTVGLAVRPHDRLSVELIAHGYQQDHFDDGLRADLVDPPARANGQSTDLGWGYDLVIGTPRLWRQADASIVLGLFEPGDAFAPRQERALFARLNLSVGLETR